MSGEGGKGGGTNWEEGVVGCSVASTDGVFDVFCLLVMFGVVLLVLQV